MADTKWSQFPSATPDNSDEVVGLHSGDNARFSIAKIVAAVRQGLASIFVPLTRTINGKGLSADITLDSSDIGAQDEIIASGILKGDGAGGVTAATAGTDYQAPLTAGTDYATPAQLADKANQAQLAYVETGTTASRDYLWDEFFWMGGILYRTTNRVNNGAPFTVGTNCEAVTSGGFNKMAMRLLGATVGSETIQPPSYQCLVLATRNTGAFLGILYTITTTTWYLIRIHNGISDISLNTSTGAITFPSYTQYVYFW